MLTLQRLQPHKGSSETRESWSRIIGIALLQPHKGSSETAVSDAPTTADGELQPHKGSSETGRRRVLNMTTAKASTAQGFV